MSLKDVITPHYVLQMIIKISYFWTSVDTEIMHIFWACRELIKNSCCEQNKPKKTIKFQTICI